MLRFLHHFGTFFLLVAVALLIVTDISAPVVANIPILRVKLANGTAAHDTSVSFGTFGWCVVDAADGNNYCSPSQVGYRPLRILNEIDGTALSTSLNSDKVTFSNDGNAKINEAADDTTAGLTKVMILHPIATGVVFIAFLLSLGASFVGSFLASMVAFLSFLITAAALICDFVWCSLVRQAVSDARGGDGMAYYSHGAWTILVAGILTLLGSIILFFTCCSARRSKRREVRTVKQPVVSDYGAPVATHRRRRWGFGRRY